MTDPISDMLTRIRNANRALHPSTDIPHSRLKESIAQQLREEGAEQALLGAGQLLEGRVDRVVWQGGPDACL
jgi:hypothetical protein